MKSFYLIFLLLFSTQLVQGQQTELNDLGAWYMYFFTTKFKNSSFGIQGDIQYRNWNIIGDTEQVLLRSGLTYTPKKTNIILTLGFANITSGQLGESNETMYENRIYQEALLPQKIGERIYLTHRFRYEQRFVEDQDFRTRYRYNLFMNIPINKKTLSKQTIYAAFYNELFINGQQHVGYDRSVPLFDRNRFYFGIGFGITDKMRFQFGCMNQSTETFSKNQLQFSLHHTF